MAQLTSTNVSNNLRVTDTLYTQTIQTQTIYAPITSNSLTFGPGQNGQVLKSNGTSIYWGEDENNTEYVSSLQGANNNGKFLIVGPDGTVILEELSNII